MTDRRCRYTPAQWEAAEVLWNEGVCGTAIATATGIRPATIRKRAVKEGWGRRRPVRQMRPDRVARVRALWCSYTPMYLMTTKLSLPRARIEALAQEHGWPERPMRRKATPGKRRFPDACTPKPGPKLPMSRRCCGTRFPASKACPRCGDRIPE